MSAWDICIMEQEEMIEELKEKIDELELMDKSQKDQIEHLTERLSETDIKPSSRDDKLEKNYDSGNPEVDKLEKNYDFIRDSVNLLYNKIFEGGCFTNEQEQNRIAKIRQDILTKKRLMEIARQHFEEAYWGEWELKVTSQVRQTLKT